MPNASNIPPKTKIGLVFSGGGSRAAFQVGILQALLPRLKDPAKEISVIIGSSIGSVNGLIFAACLKKSPEEGIKTLEDMWKIRTYKNTFLGKPTSTFIKAIQVVFFQYMAPGPKQTDLAIFNPEPLKNDINQAIEQHGGLHIDNRHPSLDAVATMTTVEGPNRRPLLIASCKEKINDLAMKGAFFEVAYLDSLRAEHGMASAALPSILPPVELNINTQQVRLVDGGICNNVPVDPAVRMGAQEIVVLDASGRKWWHDHYKTPYYTKSSWEVPADLSTFCFCPPEITEVRNVKSLGSLLKETVGRSTKDFIMALGPTWPIFKILKHKMGEELAYEVMSYAALHPDYTSALIERGYQEATEALEQQETLAA